MLDANVILRYLPNDNEEIVGKYVNTEAFMVRLCIYDKVNFSSPCMGIFYAACLASVKRVPLSCYF